MDLKKESDLFLDFLRSRFPGKSISQSGSNIDPYHLRAFGVELFFGNLYLRFKWDSENESIRYGSSILGNNYEEPYHSDRELFFDLVMEALKQKYEEVVNERDSIQW